MVEGLTAQKAEQLLQTYGFNEIPQKYPAFAVKLLRKLLSPISLMLLAAAGLSLSINKVFDFYFILVLLLINVLIALWQEAKADNAINKLNENLIQKTKAERNGHWQEIDSRYLVPGDVMELSSGEIIPADGKIIRDQHVFINESAITGESLPVEKKKGDPVYSGSFLATGMAVVRITATGAATSYGKTIISVERLRKTSLLEKDIFDIAKVLTFLSLAAVFLLSTIFIFQKVDFAELVTLDLSLVIAGIPISLPTVMTLIIEFGVVALAAKNIIVRRLSALEDLANVDYLLTDKTGTLTKNQIAVHDIYPWGGLTGDEVITWARMAAAQDDTSPIDIAVVTKAGETQPRTEAYQVSDFIPADSLRKRSTTFVRYRDQEYVLSLGAPQVVASLCRLDPDQTDKFNRLVETTATRGYRSLAIARTAGTGQESDMQMLGLITLSDTLRAEAGDIIRFLVDNGIRISMVTGDNRAIAAQISQQLSLGQGRILTKGDLQQMDWQQVKRDFFEKTSAFAEILPEDKLKLVVKAKEYFIVAVTGDGVNDLPAVKAANVGVAVKNAVAALKAAADIVLLSDGISVIRDAIIESRKIFERLYTYSLYRISESLRLIITITVLGILYRVYPLTPLQLIVIALLNDIPIISLSYDRVKIAPRPDKINAKKRFITSSLYGLVGVANSLIMFFIASNLLHLDWNLIQTIYFLKLTVSGHMLIYVAHTKDRWWKFLPSREVIWATTITQAVASLMALTGFLMPGSISLAWVVLIWLWAFLWMQVTELTKDLQKVFSKSEFSE